MAGKLRIGAHVDVFKTDQETGKQTLVSTNRPCAECGQPLEGLVIPAHERQVHAECKKKATIIPVGGR